MQNGNQPTQFRNENIRKFRRERESFHGLYSTIISRENLFIAWREFQRGKKNKKDVLEFTLEYEERLLALHQSLVDFSYVHGKYHAFMVCDPKQRNIHKAPVCDRVLHHAIHRILMLIFDQSFIFDSYSSRKNKGVHVARKRFEAFAWKLSQNNTKTVWVLKCDIRKFFDSVSHRKLLELLARKIHCKRTLNLLEKIITSYRGEQGRGIPLGNLTSQLFSNVYMDPFDQFMKRELRIKYYIRYSDDFVVLSRDKKFIENLIPKIREFIEKKLFLQLHPAKIEISKWHQGVDFLGAIIFPNFQVLRTKTRRRTIKKIKKGIALYKRGEITHDQLHSVVYSYFGILYHVNSYWFQRKILSSIEFIKDSKKTPNGSFY